MLSSTKSSLFSFELFEPGIVCVCFDEYLDFFWLFVFNILLSVFVNFVELFVTIKKAKILPVFSNFIIKFLQAISLRIALLFCLIAGFLHNLLSGDFKLFFYCNKVSLKLVVL